MPSLPPLEASEWSRFSVPHSVRLAGKYQYLLGTGAMIVATSLRLGVEVDEVAGEFALSFTGTEPGDEMGAPPADDAIADFAVRWEGALGRVAVADPSLLEGLHVHVDFGPLWHFCPAEVLLASPALAVALVTAVVSHRGDGGAVEPEELAELAGRVAQDAQPEAPALADCVYGDALLSISGGAGYAEPGGTSLNVQEVLPPDSLLLALAPQTEAAPAAARYATVVGLRQALAEAVRERGAAFAGGEDAEAALFELSGGILTEDQTAAIYGLLRVRQMIDSFLEHLGEPFVDNDRLAEICDEETAMLRDYVGFPQGSCAEIMAEAAQEGALGSKLTWAFGGHPAAVIVAPGAREEVGTALSRMFLGARFLPLDMDPTGLQPGEMDEPEDQSPG